MKNNLYSVADLVDSIIEEYNLNVDAKNIKKRKGEWINYRQKISRALHSLGIWDNGIPKTVGKKTTMYFTEQQKQKLLTDKSMYDYLRDNSMSEEIKNSKRYADIQKAINERQTTYLDYIASKEQDVYNESVPIITDKAYREYKNDMMIKALFEKFFTPINDELLLNDLYQVQIFEDELDLDVVDIEAEHRLSNPEGNYYKKKQEETNLDNINRK